MTLTRLGAAAQPSAVFGRTVLLTLVGAVLVGLLAMHGIASAGHHGSSMESLSVSSMSSGMESLSSGMESHGVAAGTTDCGGTCDAGHVMSSMTCMPALVFTGALLFEVASRRGPVVISALPALTVPALYTNGPSRPPDLTELSISRT